MLKKYFVLFSFIVSFAAYAVETNYPTVIAKYSMQNGLSNDVVYDACQDADGCMWFATADGISKFDGSNFTSFNWNLNESEITNHQALKILYLENKLYIATHFGLVVYNMEINQFSMHLPEGLEILKIRALAYASDGNLWIGSYDGQGIFKYNINENSFSRLEYEYTDNRIISLYEDANGMLFVGTHFGGVDVIDLKANRTKNLEAMPDKQVERILEDSFGNIWFGTWKGLARYDKANSKVSTLGMGELKEAKINTLDEDHNGNLWVGTENGLLSFNILEALVNPKGFKMDIYRESDDEYGLSYRTVLDLHCDQENNIWITTNSGGVNFISRFQPQFGRIIYDTRLNNSLSYRRVTSVSEDKAGNLWIATDGGGINYYNRKTRTIQIKKRSNSNLDDDAILCSLVDSDGDAWFGTYSNTLNRLIDGRKDFIVYKGSESATNTLMTGDVLCLEEDDYNRIWIGQRSGLVYFDKKENSFVQIPELKWFSVRCLFATKDGIFVGAHPGVMFYNFVTKKLEVPHPLFDNLFTNSLFVGADGRLWIGTNGQGLFSYDPVTQNLKNISMHDGLPSDNICKILQDDNSELWLATTKGLSKINCNDESLQNFSSKDGVQPGMFIENCGVKTSAGQLIFGGTDGLTLFYPTDVTNDVKTPNVIFTNFLLFNTPVAVRSDENPKSPLIKMINYTDHITLKYNESVFSIEYATVDYRSTGQVNYAYILEGADKDWNYVNNKEAATYRYLAPGTYTFKVMASNLDGVFDNTQTRSIKITITPPFYLTWWAYLIYSILFIAICYFIWNFMTVKTRALNRIRYERLERRKSEELHQEKLLFFTNVSHELKTPLTLISAPVDRLLNDESSEEKKYLLNLIKRNVARMLSNINQIVDIRKIDRDQMKLKIKELDIISFVGEIIDLFKDSAQAKNIILEYSHREEELQAWADPEFLDKILCNILSNALKYTPDHGEIIVDLFTVEKERAEDGMLIIEITDTGRGIPAEDLPFIFDRFYQAGKRNIENVKGSGIGLHLVRSLVEIHKGKIEVESKEGVGSKFILSIPYQAENYTEKEKVSQSYEYFHAEQLQAIAEIPEVTLHEQEKNGENRNKILIIDDDTGILDFLKFELGNEYEVTTAGNGKAGLEKAYEIIPDLIISDVMMPGMDGISVCKELKSNINTSHIPVILLTAKSSVDDRIEGLEVGAESYIPKPFDIRHLRVRIKKLIELRESFQSSYIKKLSDEPAGHTKGISAIDEKLLQNIIDFVKEHIDDPDINGETIARHVSMSRMSLHRKLKALTNLSAGEFIRNIRLDEAKKMLEAGGMTVSEVSYEVGYSSPSYFYTCFVKKFGVSPSDLNKKG